MSANTGRAPAIMMASALYAADSGVVMTSSPGPMSSARRINAMASVPVPTPTACAAPVAAANSASKASTSGPSTNQPLRDDTRDGGSDRLAVLTKGHRQEGNARGRHTAVPVPSSERYSGKVAAVEVDGAS